MNNKLLKSMDTLIILPIVIQFGIFLLSYETKLLETIISSLVFVSLIVYLVFSVRLRAAFEEIVNQEDRFFNKQFYTIKSNIKDTNYQISEYFERQRDIDDIRQAFRHSKIYYQKALKHEDGSKTTIDLLLVTEKGLVIVDFFEARFILKGDYQEDYVDLQYSQSNTVRIVNPLSVRHPLYQALKETLAIKNPNIIKRMMIVENESLIMGMDTLDKNQQISKEIDIPSRIALLAKESDINLSQEQIESYEQALDKMITG